MSEIVDVGTTPAEPATDRLGYRVTSPTPATPDQMGSLNATQPLPRVITPPGRPPRLHHFFEASCDRAGTATAVECENEHVSYAELDSRANRLANLLISSGLRPGDRAGILLPRSVDMYVALLAVQKANATFVPIDPESPADRVAFIASDAELSVIISVSARAAACAEARCPSLALDTVGSELRQASPHRPAPAGDLDPICYVIYTSGSTGRPKGVAVAQSSICNFIGVVPEIYGVRQGDRVYQGMTLAFDFSIEEIWPTWAVGATVIAGPTDSRRIGSGLAQFLTANRVTVLYCVPTVLATIDRDLPLVRSLLVGGEACPAELVERWATPHRRMLNTYGPTEATVTATWGELRPGRPVTIGRALPTYHVGLRDEQFAVVPDGEVGEICISGVGVALGYLNRPEQTADRFRTDADGTRIYRTGDLGRRTPAGEIAYLGRADSEVKIRGHRVDLQEIDSVLLSDPSVLAAAATLHTTDGGEPELVGYLTCAPGAPEPDELRRQVSDTATNRLPAYMRPGYLEILDALPLMPSGKVDRKRLPAPTGPRIVRDSGEHVAAGTEMEARIAAIWASVFRLDAERLSVTADFFTDLGGHSLLAARVASALREHDFAADVSVADLYAHPTVREVAALIGAPEPHAGTRSGAERTPPLRHSAGRVWRAGALQLLVVCLGVLLFGGPAAAVLGADGGALTADTLLSLLAVVPAGIVLARIVVPIIGVRLLSIRLRAGRYPLWGATFLRVWAIGLLTRIAPLGTLSGTPLLPAYLRLLGARVGKRCLLATAEVPLPSMVHLGDEVSIGYGAHVRASYVEDGRLTIKPVTVRSQAYIGANALLQAGSELGYGAALGEMSLAAEDQIIPARELWTGSPAVRAGAPDPLLAEMAARPRPADWRFSHRVGFLFAAIGVELLNFLLIGPSLVLGGWALETTGPLAALGAAVVGGPLFVLNTCLVVWAGKKLVLPRTPVGVYPLATGLGMRKWFADRLLQLSLSATNSMYATLYTMPWLRLLGAKVGKRSEVSTAAHLDPDLLTLGTESFIADMASVGSATYRNGYLAMGRTEVGARSFVGNAALLRSGSAVGSGSLIGVHTLGPVSVPDGTDWLGSPAIQLPRRQESGDFDENLTFRPSRLRVADRLAIEFVRIVLPPMLLGMAALGAVLAASFVAQQGGMLAVLLALPVIGLAAGLAVVLAVAGLKWLVVGRYRPRVEPLWDRFVRRSELITALYETAAVPALLGGLAQTPMLGVLLRLFGVRVGRRCWIGTTYLTEFDLVHLGDDVAVGPATSLQTHLFEDRVMKMSTIDIASGVSVGERTVVLYDTAIGEGATVDPLSLVMKGERMPGNTHWRGIPSRTIR